MATSTTVISQLPALRYDTSSENLTAAEEEFKAIVGDDGLILDADQCHARSSNAWTPARPDQKPAMILQPRSTEDVSSIMKICHQRMIPVTSFSGGTSLPGALISTRGRVCVDFKHMAKILHIHKADMDAVVQPGVGWRQLNSRLEEEGLFFPPDPSPDARIGGMIAMSCAGTNTYRYGTMKEWVIALKVVLADGTVVQTKQRPRKSSAGYDLTHLIIGSEGTLGLVTEAVIKLAPVPVNPHIVIATFPDNHAAVRMSLSLVNSGLILDAVELLDHMSIKAINISKLSSKYWEELPTVFLKVSGLQNTVEDLLSIIKKSAEANDCASFEATGDKERMQVLWDARKNDGKASIMTKKDPSDVFLPSDAAVPISRVADLIEESHRMLEGTGMFGSITAHLGDGNLHVKIICAANERAKGEEIIRKVESLAMEMEGTVTG